MNKDKKCSHGNVWELLAIALPMMASNACDTVMTFTDRLFLAKLGSSQMNAVLGGGLMCYMFNTFFIGLIGYSTAIVAQYYGAKQKENCAKVITQALIIALIAYPVILLLSPIGRMIFSASGIADEQLHPQTIYFNILIYASIIGLLRSVFSCFFTGIGRTRIVMVASLFTMFINVALAYILIFGKFGIPSLGIIGAAYGTIIAGIFGLMILVCAYFFGKRHSEFEVKKSFRYDSAIMQKLIKFGYPAGVEFFLNFAAYNAMVIIFQSCGQIIATAASVTLNWDMVSFVPLVGIEIGVTSLVGRYMGAKQPSNAHRAAMSGIKIGSFYSGTMLVMFALFPSILVNVFRPDQNGYIFAKALPLTMFMVKLVAFYVLAEAVGVAYSGALRGAGDTHWVMLTSVSLHWILVALLLLMLKVMHLSPQVAWVSMVAWFMFFVLAFYFRYRSGRWQDIRIINEPENVACK